MVQKLFNIAAVALAAIALVVTLFSSRSEPPPVVRAPAAGDDALAADVQELRDRIASVEDSLQYQARRINQLEATLRGMGVAGAAGQDAGSVTVSSAIAAEIARLRDDVNSLMVGEVINSESGREHLKEAVRSVQEEMRQEQRQRWQQQAAQAMAELDANREQRWRDFARRAGLNYQQEQTVIGAVNAEAERRKELLKQLESGEASRRDLRPQLQSLREETERTVKAALTEDQWKQFQDERRTERQSMRGFGGPWGGRGGGDRGNRGADGR
ncbi:MAG: hypothetical protein IRZ16_00255 [Myxococcaceae bacterium]|nr:hypothetical protein [Myxococcaceae bacterium]